MKHKSFPIFMILTVFFLSACGLTDIFMGDGNETAITEEEPPVQTEPTAAETSSSAEITEETMEPTVAEPTAAEISQTGTNSACYHPFFPVVEGATWTYAYASGETYTMAIEETGENTFLMTQDFDEGDTQYAAEWNCSEDSILRATFGQADILNQLSGEEEGEEFEFEFEALEWEGETLPAPELMAQGYAWTSNYKLAADYDFDVITGVAEVNVTIDHVISLIEEVTVEAGTFPEAYRVDSIGEIEMIMFMGETQVPFTGFDFSYSTWYVEGIGMVKTSDEFSGIASDLELIEYSFPD